MKKIIYPIAMFAVLLSVLLFTSCEGGGESGYVILIEANNSTAYKIQYKLEDDTDWIDADLYKYDKFDADLDGVKLEADPIDSFENSLNEYAYFYIVDAGTYDFRVLHFVTESAIVTKTAQDISGDIAGDDADYRAAIFETTFGGLYTY